MKLNITDLNLTTKILQLYQLRNIKTPCPICGKKQTLFCHRCSKNMIKEQLQIAKQNQQIDFDYNERKLTLPINTIIFRSKLERKSISSIPYIASMNVTNLKIIEIVDDFNENMIDWEGENYLLFPDENSIEIKQMDIIKQLENQQNQTQKHNLPIDNINFIIIDCKWTQTKKILSHQFFKKLQHIKLVGYESDFWRPNGNKFEGSLCSAECLYWMNKEILQALQNKIDEKEIAQFQQDLDDSMTLYAYNIYLIKHQMFLKGTKTLKPRLNGYCKQYDDWEEIDTQLKQQQK